MGIIYESLITENDKIIHDKYVNIVLEYLLNICYKKMSAFIVSRGLDTITHVFIMLLYYTQHLETAYTYSSKDAVIYVYKKRFIKLNRRIAKRMRMLRDIKK